MSVKIEELKRQFFDLPADRAAILAEMYSGQPAVGSDREALWVSIVADSPEDKRYLETALRLEQPIEEESAAVEQEDEAVVAEPEAEEEERVREPPEPVPSRFGRRTDEEIANVLYPRKGG